MADKMKTLVSKVAGLIGSADQMSGADHSNGARGGVPLNEAGTSLSARGSGIRAGRKRRHLAVALAGVLAMLASILVLVAPAANPASAQSTYNNVLLRIYNFNDDEYHPEMHGGHQDNLGQDASRIVPSGVLISYTITPRTGSHDGCTSETTRVFRLDGSARPESSTPFYENAQAITDRASNPPVRRPSGAGSDCVYDVVFHSVYHSGSSSWYGPHRKVRNNAGRTFMADQVIDGADQGNQHDFDKGFATAYEKIPAFQPDITIDLPALQIGNFEHTSLEGETIEVAYERASGPTNGCGGTPADNLVLTVDAGGTAALPPASESVLWDQPSGERTSCTYTLTFPDTAAGGKLAKTASPNEDRDTSNADKLARSAYERAERTFDLEIKVGVTREPGDSNSGTLEAMVTPVGAAGDGSHATCTDRFPVTLTWDASQSRYVGTRTGVYDHPAGATMASQVCQYDLAWPTVSGYERNTGLTRINGGTPSVLALYRSNKFVQVQVQMNNFNHADTAGSHQVPKVSTRIVPEGAVLRYSITPRTDTGDLMSGCTDAATHSETAGTGRRITGDHNYELQLRTDAAPADTYCAYVVEFHISSHDDGGAISWYGPHAKQGGITYNSVIEDGRADARTSYEQILHFQPEIELTLPDDVIPGRPDTTIVGETVVVTFAQASGNTVANCGGVPATGLVATIGAGGTVMLPTEDVAALWDQPAGERDSCEYTLTFPDDNGGKLVKVAGVNEDRETQNSDKDASSAYERVQGTFDLNLEAEGLLQGQSYTAMVTAIGADAQTGAHATCSDRVSVSLMWDSTAMKHTGSADGLIDYPRGAAAASDVCEYRIAWPQNLPGYEANSPDPAHTSADGTQGSTPSRAVYTRLPGTLFGVDIQISVPQYDRAGTSDNNFYHADDATRTFFEVDIARSGGPAAGCSDFQDLQFAIGQGGSVAPVAGAIRLIDVPDGQPDGQSDSCVYSVTFSDSLGSAAGVDPPWTLGLENPTAARSLSNADAASRMVSVRYLEAASDFTPTVDITLPDLDGAASGESLFAGAEFTVGFAPVANSNAECSDAVSYTFTVQTDGELMPAPALADLVDVPVGQAARCEYDVTVGPDSVSSASGSPFVWTLDQDSSPAPTSMVNQGSADVTASYSLDGDTTFAATADVTVPGYNSDDDPASHAFAGAQIRVSHARPSAQTACSADAAITWTIGADGSLSTSDSLVLVDYPAGETTRCVYTLTWSANELGGANALGLHTGATASVSGAARTMAAEYRAPTSNFSPSVSGTVELVDEDADEVHDLSGVTVEVSYAAADGSDSGCSASGSAPAVSETYVVGDDGTLSLAQPPAVAQAQTAVSLVDRPTGVNARCAYALTYPEAVTAAADPEAPAGTEPVSVPVAAGTLTQLTAVDALVLNYATPPVPPVRVRVDPIPLMSANRGVERLPVRVALNVPSGVFAAVDTFEVLVWVPDACGSDTFLFGGVPASAGVAYAASASDTGQVVVVGEGASQLNRRAEYSLPPYVDGAGGREACAVRVSALASPQGCSMVGSAGTDSQGRAYIESVWAQGSTGFDLTASFDCPDLSVGDPTSQASVSLAQGWVTLSFNGPSGTTPREFAQLLDGAVDSMWAWNPVSQSWRGWTQQHGTVGLATLTRGQTVMAYVPAAAEVAYSPDDLLALPAPTGSISLSPGYNLVTYNGNAPVRLSALLREPWPINVVFLWHTATQTWRYYLPEFGPIAGLGIDWFSTLNPGDTVFLHSQAFGNVTYPWA